MAKSTMCEYSHSDHALPNCKCVMRRCAKFPSVNLPDQETDDQCYYTIPSISFHIYHLIARCSTHGSLPLNEKKIVASVKWVLLHKNPQKYTLEKS